MTSSVPEIHDDALHGGTMPLGDGDLHVETRGLAPIPESSRYGNLLRVFTVWFPPNLIMLALFTGVVVGTSGLGFWWGLVAVLAGNAVANAPAAYLASWGPRTGVAQLPLARLVFGKSVVAPGVVTWISMVMYDALNAVFGGTAVHLLIGVPFAVGVILIIIPQILLSVVGYEAIHQYGKWTSVALGVMFVILSIKLFGVGTWGTGPAPHAKHIVGTFFAMLALVTSFNITWMLYASDYTRYLPSKTPPRKVSAVAFAAMFVSTVWVMTLGLAATSIASNQTSAGVKTLMGGGFLGGLAMVTIYVGTLAINSMDDYTGSLSLQAVNLRIHRHLAAGIGGVLCFGVALWLNAGGTFATKAVAVLVLVSYWVTPFFSIIVIDWVQHRGRLAVERVTEWDRLTTNWRPIGALLIAFLIQVPFMNVSGLWVGPVPKQLDGVDLTYFVGFVAGAVAYLAFQHIGEAVPDPPIQPVSDEELNAAISS